MKALSIRQPWAWLIVNGHKDIENRSRRTSHRGPLLIHASSKMTRDDYYTAFAHADAQGITLPPFDNLERGGIVGQVDLADCVDRHPSPWFFGPVGYVLENPQILPFRPCNGQLGIFIPSLPVDSEPGSAWAISGDDENYGHIKFPTREAAIDEGLKFFEGEPFYVGECVSPTPPEDWFSCDDWLENVSCQDDYAGDHADGWEISTKEQRDELNAEVRKVMAAWLDRHNLRPAFWNIGTAERIVPPTVEFVGIDGKPETDPSKCGFLRINTPAALHQSNAEL